MAGETREAAAAMDQSRRAESLWTTLDLLVGPDKKRTSKDILEDVDEWLDMVRSRIAVARSEVAVESIAAAAAAAAVERRAAAGESGGGPGGRLLPGGAGASGLWGRGRRVLGSRRAASASAAQDGKAGKGAKSGRAASPAPSAASPSAAPASSRAKQDEDADGPGIPPEVMAACFDDAESVDDGHAAGGLSAGRGSDLRRTSSSSGKGKSRKDPGDMTQMLICRSVVVGVGRGVSVGANVELNCLERVVVHLECLLWCANSSCD